MYFNRSNTLSKIKDVFIVSILNNSKKGKFQQPDENFFPKERTVHSHN